MTVINTLEIHVFNIYDLSYSPIFDQFYREIQKCRDSNLPQISEPAGLLCCGKLRGCSALPVWLDVGSLFWLSGEVWE